MVQKLDFEKLTLKDALDLATLVEEEAKDRYSELADQMEIHRNPEAARFFRYMLQIESTHEVLLTERRKKLFGEAPVSVSRAMIFDVEAPDYDEARADMTVRQALEVALRAEKKAWAFFDAAAGKVQDAEIRTLFTSLRDEEVEHQHYVQRQMDKLPAEEPVDDSVYADPPNAL
jgi:rubrerythrin